MLKKCTLLWRKAGCVGRDAKNRPICFDFKISGCNKAPAGGSCAKGRHVCFRGGCFKTHAYKEAKSAEAPSPLSDHLLLDLRHNNVILLLSSRFFVERLDWVVRWNAKTLMWLPLTRLSQSHPRWWLQNWIWLNLQLNNWFWIDTYATGQSRFLYTSLRNCKPCKDNTA